MHIIEKITIIFTMITIALYFGFTGCQTPGNVLVIDDVERILDSDGELICLDDGFDRICAIPVPGPAGKDGTDGTDGIHGKDGQTLIAIREVSVEVIVETIIETIVIKEFVKEIPVEVVIEKVVTEFVEREVPIEVFVEKTVEVIKEVVIERVVEKEVIIEVPVEVIVEKIVYQAPPETPPVIVENKLYDSQEYLDWVADGKTDSGVHEHTFWHTHHGKRHGHRFIHPNGQADDWEHEHEGYGGLEHD